MALSSTQGRVGAAEAVRPEADDIIASPVRALIGAPKDEMRRITVFGIGYRAALDVHPEHGALKDGLRIKRDKDRLAHRIALASPTSVYCDNPIRDRGGAGLRGTGCCNDEKIRGDGSTEPWKHCHFLKSPGKASTTKSARAGTLIFGRITTS